MLKKTLPKELEAEVKEYVKSADLARDASNAQNRQKTKLRNAVKAHWAKEQLPHGSFVRSGGLEIKYEAAESEKLSTDEVIKMYENDEITRDQLVRLLNVDRTEATNILGGDIVASISYVEVGKKADIRIGKLPIENIDDKFVGIAEKKRKVRRRKIGGKKQETATVRNKRRIKVRSND